MTPTQHVMLALILTGLILAIGGDRWSPAVNAIKPVQIAPRAGK